MTLAGQLIDTAGTMSGGGSRVSKGRMSNKLVSDVTPQQLAKLEQKFKNDEKALQVLIILLSLPLVIGSYRSNMRGACQQLNMTNV